jgi:LPXTG-motif cell wall-anchored protein
MEQLGITEEQVPVIAGSIGILILIIGGFVYYRRKGREYE